MYFVYCLYSDFYKKIYIGRTSDLQGRLEAHNHISNKGYTKRYQPWVIIYFESFDSILEASRREKYFKTGIGRAYLKIIISKKKL
jgi:putative endonuclease